MFFIDFHAPCGVLGVEHPDTFSPVLLPAKQVLGAANIVTAAPVAANLASTIIAYGVTPDLPPFPQKCVITTPVDGGIFAPIIAFIVTPDGPPFPQK